MHKGCLNEETLTGYLEGGLAIAARMSAEQHLVSCDTCRSQLVYYMRILDEDVREEEESVVDTVMATWSPDRVPVGSARPFRVAGLGWRPMSMAAGVLLAVALGVVFGLRSPSPTGSEAALEAYLREHRPFRPRTSLQESPEDFVTYSETRDANRSAPAVGAEAQVIGSYIDQEAGSAHVQGLAHLVLEGNFDEAIEALERADRESAGDPGVQNDLGIVWHLRGSDAASIEEETQAYGRAEGYFRRAIELDGDFAPARFNMVLLYMDEMMEAEARSQSERYLEVDPDSPWSDELRQFVAERGR